MRKIGKKSLSLLLALIMVLGMLPTAALAANEDFNINDEGELIGYHGPGGDVVIPDGVTSIRYYAFAWDTSLTSVIIPNSVTSIGERAFRECTGLTSVTIPDSVTSIGVGAFSGCTGLTSVTIPDSVTSIGDGAFGGCTGLTSATIPGSIVFWGFGWNLFGNCTGLTSVTIQDGVPYIAPAAFGNCTSLTDVIIPDSVTSIERDAFNCCESLTSVTIPNSVTDIRWCAFYNCNSLKDVYYTGTVAQWQAIKIEANNTALLNSTIHYAQEEPTPASYTVTFNANGGSVYPTSKTVTEKESYGDLPTPTRKDHAFDGWYTSSSGGTQITSDTTVNLTGDQTLYAHWTANAPKTHTVTFNANGGSVYPSSKTVTEKQIYGDLPTPTRKDYTFDGWYTSATGGTKVTATTTVTLTGDQTLYAHWTSTVDPYNLGDETYSFANFTDTDALGHCFGMSITSAGYHNNLLDIGKIGGNANTSLYSFSETNTVKQPICYYQKIQGSYRDSVTVAGGSSYLTHYNNIASDWQQVVNYVRDHKYDNMGLLQIGFRKDGEGGHAINFLRYENVNGQDRIYAYDNNFPTKETYFYRDSSGNVRQAPVQTFSGAIDCIALRDCKKYFNSVGGFDFTHILYMAENAASVEGNYPCSYMETSSGEEYVMYEIPENVDRVVVIPKRDNATFVYMNEEYKFGKITDDTRGELKLASSDEGTVGTDSSFQIYEDDSVTSSYFTDVPSASWYNNAVYWAVEQGITAGTGTNPPTFSPERTCTETEILTFLWRANGEPISTAQLPFILKNSWAESALRWAFEKGMINASFNENTPCTRAAAVKFIWQVAGAPGASGSTFTDVPAGADYARAVAWAVSKGVTAGTSATTFSPSKTCSRAEIVTFLYRDRTGKT